MTKFNECIKNKARSDNFIEKYVGDYMQYFAWYFMEVVSNSLSWETRSLYEVAK